MFFYIHQLNLVEYNIILIFVASLLLSIIIMFLSVFLAVQQPYAEKVSAYECGFEPFEDARNKFDVKFYIVGILFIIFDLEVVYLLPWTVNLVYIGFQGFLIMMFFIILLILGFIYEIIKGALDW